MSDLIISGCIHTAFGGPYGFNDLLFRVKSLTKDKPNLCSLKGQPHRGTIKPSRGRVKEKHPRSLKSWRSQLEELWTWTVCEKLQLKQGQMLTEHLHVFYWKNGRMNEWKDEWMGTRCYWWFQTWDTLNPYPLLQHLWRKYNTKIGITDHNFTLVISN